MNRIKGTITLVVIILTIIILYMLIANSNKITQEEIDWLKKQDSIIYAANENAPPLRFVDEKDNQYKGVVVDYINQISLEIGVDIQTVPMQWNEALESLKKGETHICDMFINEERNNVYLFTNPIYNLRTVLLLRKDHNIELNEINNLKIATEKGDYANNYLIENYPDAELVYTHNVAEGYKLLLQGEVDAVIGDEPIITYLMDNDKDIDESKFSNLILYELEVVLAVSKDKPELVSILNKAISQVNKKGSLEEIQQKWFGISTPLIKIKTYAEIIDDIIILVVIIIAIFSIVVFNNLSLKKQVNIRTRELEQSRNELQKIFDGISEFMMVVDSDKRVLKANKSFADFLGVQSINMVGELCDVYLNNFYNEPNILMNEILDSHKDIKKESMIGNEVYELSIQLLKGINNAFLISIKDITLDKINRNKMLQNNKMIAVGQLAAGMAHEIRNPLGIIRTQSYLIRINEKFDEAINKSLDFIDSAVNRASSIIDNILSFSRFSSNAKQLINVPQMIDKIIEMHSDIIKNKSIVVEVNSSIDKEVNLSFESMEHIFMNLMSNSIDAIDDNGIIRIYINLEKDSLVFTFKDNGIGISEDDIGNIFNPFFTTKELGKGTGLGLFIVYSEIEKLNGKIDVKSKLGEGTIFTITIPLERKTE
ncbi:transporter substrate-binding domain-containing protein [Sedimentibacter sp.]|uniref:transporter substrate-binding domain-containing protein n=1 Tax=Sedimentibacter sp. TaxID=1960295 RepID=UPI0028AC0079|nr:transporter substrate-binding domain-containing protein [Sedimentibacter sp.]